MHFLQKAPGVNGLSNDVLNKIPICSVAVISNPLVCNVCAFHTMVPGEIKLFVALNKVQKMGKNMPLLN